MVWAELGSDPPSPMCTTDWSWGGENGHGFSRRENPWFAIAVRPRGQASLRLMYVL